jgi:hypothetical protein
MDGNLMVMEDVAQRKWMAQCQLNGERRRDSNLTAMDGEGQRGHNGDGPAIATQR